MEITLVLDKVTSNFLIFLIVTPIVSLLCYLGYKFFNSSMGMHLLMGTDKSEIPLDELEPVYHKKKYQNDTYEFTIYDNGIDSYATISKYIAFDTEKTLAIPGFLEIDDKKIPIRAIDESVFKNDKSLEKVIIPETIETISNNVFSFSSLSEIVLHKDIKKICRSAFANCKLSNLFLDGFEEILIEENAFSWSSIEYLKLTKNIHIEKGSFHGSHIKKLEITTDVIELKPDLFAWCDFPEVIIPEGITEIPSNCFYGCNNLKKIYIPNSVDFIYDSAFKTYKTSHVHKKDGSWDLRYNSYSYEENLDLIIYCNGGSYAQEFAKKNNFKCRPATEYNLT